MVLRTVAKDDSKSIEVLIAAVPSAVTGAVIAVEKKRPTMPVARELFMSAVPIAVAALPIPVHIDRAVCSCRLVWSISERVRPRAALALFRAVSASTTALLASRIFSGSFA